LKLFLRFIPLAAIMGMIFYLSHQPGDFVKLPQLVAVDKLLHGIAYAILAGTFLYSLYPFIHDSNRAVTCIIVVVMCILFGVSDEFHQSFVPGRFVSAWDVAADGCGALLVVGLWYKWSAKKRQELILTSDKKGS
jgi:VanZ family protein